MSFPQAAVKLCLRKDCAAVSPAHVHAFAGMELPTISKCAQAWCCLGICSAGQHQFMLQLQLGQCRLQSRTEYTLLRACEYMVCDPVIGPGHKRLYFEVSS